MREPIIPRVLLHLDRPAAAACAIVAIASFAARCPIPGLAFAAIPGVPLLVVGQLWCIVVQQRRRSVGSISTVTKFLWSGDLSGRERRILDACWFAAALIAGTSLLWLRDGGPTDATSACRWPLQNHSTITCVSHQRYLSTGAAVQRGSVATFGAFFVVHYRIALGELRRWRTSWHGVVIE